MSTLPPSITPRRRWPWIAAVALVAGAAGLWWWSTSSSRSGEAQAKRAPAPIVVTTASLKSNRSKWVRFVKAYLEATHFMTTNKEGSIQVLRRIIPGDEKETLEHAYEEMRARATVDLVPPDAAVENLIKMMTYVDKRAATVDRAKLADYSILKELSAAKK